MEGEGGMCKRRTMETEAKGEMRNEDLQTDLQMHFTHLQKTTEVLSKKKKKEKKLKEASAAEPPTFTLLHDLEEKKRKQEWEKWVRCAQQ